MKSGRNDPCPCGSGRKYKKCHLAAETAPSAAATTDLASPFHKLDNRLVMQLGDYGMQRFPDDFINAVETLDSYDDIPAEFAAPWIVYVDAINGRPIVDSYLDERGWSLTRGEREWLEYQQKSWLSLWEVVAVKPGIGLDLRDLLTGQTRSVHEVRAARSLEPHLVILCRVIDTPAVSVLCGTHPNPLRPLSAERVAERMRKLLRRKGLVPPERLREQRIVWKMLEFWSDEIDAMRQPPTLTNTDGDPLLLTDERWTFDPPMMDAVRERIAAIRNAHPDEKEDTTFRILRPGKHDGESTVVAIVEIGQSRLVASTNSLARADAARAMIEQACGSILKAGVRTHSDPTSLFEEMQDREDDELEPETPEDLAMVLAYKKDHYARWLDDALPALGGQTPREAARDKSRRRKLMALLDQLELGESHMPEGSRFDVMWLRRELGLVE